MPEGRMLKRAISESKSLGALASDSARLLYTWLIPWLDVEGRHSADPEIIKGHVFPKIRAMTTRRIYALLLDLADTELITLYRNNGEMYLQLKGFREHQKLDHNREAPSKIPSPKPENIVNSRVLRSNSGELALNISKVNISKVQLKAPAEDGPERHSQTETESIDVEKKFAEFWEAYPQEGRHAKQESRVKFGALVRRGELSEFIKGFHGYLDFLKYQRVRNKFEQRPLYAKTFLGGRWREFVDFKYEAEL